MMQKDSVQTPREIRASLDYCSAVRKCTGLGGIHNRATTY